LSNTNYHDDGNGYDDCDDGEEPDGGDDMCENSTRAGSAPASTGALAAAMAAAAAA